MVTHRTLLLFRIIYSRTVEMGGCGGALIAPDTVLFAAHCADYTGRQVIVGSYEKKKVEHGAVIRYCDEWKKHPEYGVGHAVNNDVALCKLNEPVFVDESKVKLVWNQDPMVPAEDDDLIVMGMGRLAEDKRGPDFIHNVTVPVISNDDCNSAEMYNGQITDKMFCAGFREGGRDSCQGDSGGPIVKREYQGDGTFVDIHVGIVSWGKGCAGENTPGVYARTSSASPFIRDTVCNEFNSIASFCDNNIDTIQTPEDGPISCDEHELDVSVETDVFPFETSWSLLDRKTKSVLMERQYYLPQYQNNHKVCVQRQRCYTFDITDLHGDGLCYKPDDCGSYSLRTLKEDPFASGSGDFETKETVNFCIDLEGKMVKKLVPLTDEQRTALKEDRRRINREKKQALKEARKQARMQARIQAKQARMQTKREEQENVNNDISA
jgi:hypothetical protein